MKGSVLRAIAASVLAPLAAAVPVAVPAGFQKASAHVYWWESGTGAGNTSAVVTAEGVALVDPPPEREIPALLNALKAVTSRPVHWVIHTDYLRARTGGAASFLKQGSAFICSRELDRLAASAPAAAADPASPAVQPRPSPRFVFDKQLHLFPAGIEIRVAAIRSKARTAGDVFVFIPSEKVLLAGDFVAPGSFPEIDGGPGEGTAAGWIEGLRQVVDAVPLLKSAMPQPKPDPSVPAEPEKTLEELVTVIPGHGAPSNLQQVKALLASAQKLRAETTRAVRSGLSREEFLKSLSGGAYGEYANLEAFAGRLFDDLPRK